MSHPQTHAGFSHRGLPPASRGSHRAGAGGGLTPSSPPSPPAPSPARDAPSSRRGRMGTSGGGTPEGGPAREVPSQRSPAGGGPPRLSAPARPRREAPRAPASPPLPPSPPPSSCPPPRPHVLVAGQVPGVAVLVAAQLLLLRRHLTPRSRRCRRRGFSPLRHLPRPPTPPRSRKARTGRSKRLP